MPTAANTLEHHWMPFTANRDFKAEPRILVEGDGVWFTDHRGQKILDGSSALFCSAAGHGRSEIAQAVHDQLLKLDYTTSFQLGHPAAFDLARAISDLMPEAINHVFFANSGSEAVDTAMKIAMAYWDAKGEAGRTHFVSRERAYHGVNIGGLSLSGLPNNRKAFGGVIPGVLFLRHTWLEENRFSRGQPETGAELADDLARFVDEHGADAIAACFIEPVAGSTGCLVPPKGYLERIREICDDAGILLIFDEVICGFGRLGTPFSMEAFGVEPDMVTMAKAITNGAIPMGAVAVRDDIYETVVETAPAGAVELFHGYTFSAHPAACAAALAALRIYEKEKLFERAGQLSGAFLDAVFSLRDVELISDIRGIGLISGIDIAPGERPGARGAELQKRLFANGLHIKFTGDTGVVAPPLVSDETHFDQMVAILRATIEDMPR
jgi:beta-alanine--pyruvate transaminase